VLGRKKMLGKAPSSSKDSNTTHNNDTANQIEEWKQAREVLKSFDEHLHDLRKYAFSFLTALMAAESILLPSKDMPTEVKFAVFLVTLLLIAAAHLFDKNYRVIQQAANTRALVLERKLNLELSEDISIRHGKNRVNLIVVIVYILFIVGVLLLGGFVLQPHWGYVGGLAGFGIIIAVVPIFTLGLRFAYKEGEDWTVSPLECTSGDIVRITLNNLSKKTEDMKEKPADLREANDLESFPFKVPHPIVFNEGKLIWEIRSEGGPVIRKETAKAGGLKVYYSYTWIWDTSNVGKGVYQLRRGDWPVPLFTMIISDNTK
jgi:hypothetical protein